MFFWLLEGFPEVSSSIFFIGKCMRKTSVNLLRYPGGKQRYIEDLEKYLPIGNELRGRYVEPFIGGAAVFFFVDPDRALLSDLNSELIDLFECLKHYPNEIWQIYCSFPSTKHGYYEIRDTDINALTLHERAARLLFLNRTCFKGMWRHNSLGKFNVGYGGQDRRWVINEEMILQFSFKLKRAELVVSDFEPIIDECSNRDFLFLDPPYKPGGRELKEGHYIYSKFTFDDYKRLALALRRATDRDVRWVLTISSHNDILNLFQNYQLVPFKKGTGELPGLIRRTSGEVLVLNNV